MSKDLPSDTIVRFEAGHGKLIDDISLNCFIYCTSFVEHPHEVEPLRKKAFPDKDKFIFITSEDYFERRCGEAIRREMKVAQASESVYIYGFNGKVVYTDLPKETHLNYKDIEKTIEPLLINLPFLYEKPAEYSIQNEFRFVWLCTNKPINEDYRIYSIANDNYVINIDPNGCISQEPSEFIPSKKSISVWDLNK